MYSKHQASKPTTPPDWERMAALLGLTFGRVHRAFERFDRRLDVMLTKWRQAEHAFERSFEQSAGQSFCPVINPAYDSSTPEDAVDTLSETPAVPFQASDIAGDSATVEPDLVILPRTQQDVWDILAGERLLAREIAERLGMHWTREDAIRKRIEKLRKAGLEIRHTKCAGYWRPDAPPSNAFTSGSRPRDGQR